MMARKISESRKTTALNFFFSKARCMKTEATRTAFRVATPMTTRMF